MATLKIRCPTLGFHPMQNSNPMVNTDPMGAMCCIGQENGGLSI